MRTSGTAWHGPSVDMTDAGERPSGGTRSRGRAGRRILITVGVLLVGLGAAVVLTPVDGAPEGRSCGSAPSVAAAVGLDSAAHGDGEWCRSEGRSDVAGGMLVLVLPGALLLRWQLRTNLRARLADTDPMVRAPAEGTSGSSESPRDVPPGVTAPAEGMPGERADLYLDAQKAVVLLLLAPWMFFLPPVMWVAARAGMLGLKRRPVLTLDDAGLTDHRYGLELPWRLLREVTLAGSGTRRHIAIDVSDFRPLRPPWRLGAAMRWSALRLASSRRRIRLGAWGIDGVEAFVDDAASRVLPTPRLLADRLVLYRWSGWLAGLPGGAVLATLVLHTYLNPEGLRWIDLVLIPAALWLLWRGVSAVRGRPLLTLDREGITVTRRRAFHATWDEVDAVEFVPAGGERANELVVRLRHRPGALDQSGRGRHASPADQVVNLDGLSAPAHEIAKMAEHLHAGHRDGTVTASPQAIGTRPNRLAAVAAVAMALTVAGVGWYTRPSGSLEAGDCYRESGANQVRWIPCDQPHDGEIFLVLDHPADQGTPFPGSASVSTWAGARCDPAFRSYVGKQRVDDAVTYAVWGPDDETWTDGGRTVMCAVVSGSGAKLTDRVNAS